MRPDVVVVDPRLPDVEHGLDFIRRLRAMAPERPDRRHGRPPIATGTRPRSSGADAFIRKTFRPNELISAIEAAVPPAELT